MATGPGDPRAKRAPSSPRAAVGHPGVEPFAYCRERAAPPGSTLYYGLLFTPPGLRERLLALHALEAELLALVLDASDLAISRRRLAWWSDELAAGLAGRGSHPVVRALLADAGGSAVAAAAGQSILQGVAEIIEGAGFGGHADLERHCQLTTGATLAAGARLAGYRAAEIPARLEALGTAIGLARAALDPLPRDGIALTLVPRDDLGALGARVEDLREPGSRAGRAVLAHQVERAERRIREALESLPADEGARHRSALTLARIHLALLRRSARRGYPQGRAPVGITPLRKLWIAWRVARRATEEGDHP
jgi:15-cis-phytoene synthase